MIGFPPPEGEPWALRGGSAWTLHVRVQPGARRSEVVGVHDEELKIRLAAPAVEGRANEELVRFVAVWAGVPRRAVRIRRGHHSRSKVVEVDLP